MPAGMMRKIAEKTMWFTRLTGFPDDNPDLVRNKMSFRDGFLESRVNGRRMQVGALKIPNLNELRQSTITALSTGEPLTFREVVGDVKELHQQERNAHAVFQVASQFNLLEMVSPDVSPEDGISRYEHDLTQGPACAIACGAGAIYRNYFVPIGRQIGQTSDIQIDCLADLGTALGNIDERLWAMTNGYALPNEDGLQEITRQLVSIDPTERDRLKGLLRIGIQEETEVTLGNFNHLVTQAYCSALPVAYTPFPKSEWESFARLVLEAAYEACFHVAVLNKINTGVSKLFLTQLGGGAFGNQEKWIMDAIMHSLELFSRSGLDVSIISYGSSSPQVMELLRTR